MAAPNEYSSPPGVRISDHRERRDIPRTRKRSPSPESDRKRHRADHGSPGGYSRPRSYDRPGWERDGYSNSRMGGPYHGQSKNGPSYSGRYQGQYDRNRGPPRGYENGFGASGGGASGPLYHPRPAMPMHQANMQQTAKSRRLYVGNIPFQAGLTDVALTQFFSALYVAGFRANRPGELLPVVSFWLHGDGKFGFVELRGEQEAVNMMQFNGVVLHGRPIRVNRPSDYRPELHNPSHINLVPDQVNVQAVLDLCQQIGGIVGAPAQLAVIAASQATRVIQPQVPPSLPARGSPYQQPPAAPHVSIPATGAPPSVPPSQTSPKAASDAPVPKAAISRPDPPQPTPKKGNRVVSLKNLCRDEDLSGDQEYEELLADVKDECSGYGGVNSINIPREGPWKGTAFVEFADVSVVSAAVDALGKRVFDSRQIEAVALDGYENADEAANRRKM